MTLPSIVGSLSARFVLLGSVMDFNVDHHSFVFRFVFSLFFMNALLLPLMRRCTKARKTFQDLHLFLNALSLALISFSMAVDIQGGLSLRIFRAR